jgi:3-hydroxyisobutyrate dehydrogenase-like beta-hydroxyacid dehydrogenase
MRNRFFRRAKHPPYIMLRALTMTIALLHPGEMGAAVGACLVSRGVRVVCVAEGRSPATRKRAADGGLSEVPSLDRALETADAVLSICVPSGAFDVARSVAARGFRGIYIDANAVSPAHAREIGTTLEAGGASFVDGGIIGLPPTASRTTRLYLCGAQAPGIAELFAGSQTHAILMEGAIGAASAIKVCFAAYNKGETALLGIIRALAKFEGVDDALMKEWSQSQPGAAARSGNIAARAFKAWRWAGEMEEIAASFDHAGLPSGFLANAEIYRRLEMFKDCSEPPSLETVTESLRQNRKNVSAHHSR